ncbi:DUF5133 domain-containing protein [Streptomyces microflavus]|jgi:hypothetical protein|uniref:DUF5133 domain-containing protein n=1 Tax=Streptomyces microflavus TaxID=1919 RepID=A0A7J0CH86_STRMI|nr:MULTISPECIES: DUF5133 domain-containing protein [Streptomyces]MCX4650846.1 DUF5133 domain-containing protein [Streptomyces microflavus]MDX2977694.1 DUF5133 domain-containing protein [Streptomyces sp. NRRL_B-2249]WSS38220.1 DUF5133 domain-containing protein [Streptomyces microflavus]WST13061.1 DUF5133 domain-containing protein [Streptomyces microflavus]GFN01850.1 hypothetical protein Smic_04060 [Streptomyces microflavus]
MLMAHPAVLEELLRRYEELRAQQGEGGDGVARGLEDVSYTLCVSTGTREIAAALVAAREQLRRPAARRNTPVSTSVPA